MKLKKQILNINLRGKIIIIFVLVIVMVSLIINIIKNSIENYLSVIAENEITNISTYIVNEAVNASVNQQNTVSDTTKMITNSSGEIISVDFDTVKVNKILTEVNNKVLLLLKNIELEKYNYIDSKVLYFDKNRAMYYVPYGLVTKNPLLISLGPRIPLRINVIGNVKSNISTNLTPYGINNSLLKMSVVVNVNVRYVMPFISKNINIENEIPVVLKIINGKVPDVYGSNYAVNSPLLES